MADMPEAGLGAVWIIWPQAPRQIMDPLIAKHQGRVVGVSDVLDDATARWPADGLACVIVNALTPGSQPFDDWIRQMRTAHPETRWVVALPHPAEHPETHRWVQRLYVEAIYDWVFDGPDLLADIEARLTRPRTWADARAALGSADPVDIADDAVVLEWEAPPAESATDGPSLWHRLTAKQRQFWRKQSDRAAAAATAKPPEAASPPMSVVRRRVWLVLGASGGVGTTTLVAALALWWAHRWPLTVGVIDASATGGFVGLPLGVELVHEGWEAGHPLPLVAGRWHQRHWLVPQGIAPGRRPGGADVVPTVAAARQAPVDVWLVDGGLDVTLIGRGAAWWDGVVAVVRPDWPSVHAATRLASVWRDAPAFAGVVLMQHRPGRVTPGDWTDVWQVPVLAVVPPGGEAVDALWRHGRVPDAWHPVCDQLTRQMLVETADAHRR